jgi:zinc and cadmium transporter
MILQVIICSLVGGLFSILGGVALALSKKRAKYASYATAFAAGALIAAAFMDLLPEAVEEGDPHQIMLFTMVGLVFFFLLEGVIHWFHKHTTQDTAGTKPINSMIVIGDTIHNFIDGTAIAAGFLISPVSGVIVTLAVVAHEIPQEIGDFGVMMHNGVSRGRAILINALSACASTVGAVIFYLLGSSADISLAPLLGVVAGFFIYIAATDIIPTIHREQSRKAALKKSGFLLIGVVLISLLIVNVHSLAHEHSGEEHHHDEVECIEEHDE